MGGDQGENGPQRSLNTFQRINLAQTLFSGHAAIQTIISNKRKPTPCWPHRRRPEQSPSSCPQYQPVLLPILTVSCLIVSSPGVRPRFGWEPEGFGAAPLQTELSIRIHTHPGGRETVCVHAVLLLEVRFFKRLVQIMKSHISPCWELDPSVTGLPGWKRGYVLGKPGGPYGGI